MNRVIVLCVGIERVTAIAYERDAAVWERHANRDGPEPLASVVEGLIENAPRSRLRQNTAIALVGPASVQTRSIDGLSASDNLDTTTQFVRENASRFFLTNGDSLSVTRAWRDERSRIWCAAFDQELVSGLREGCEKADMHLRMVLPIVALLPRLLGDGRHSWHDGHVRAEVEVCAGQLGNVRRSRMHDGAPSPEASTLTDAADLGIVRSLPREVPLAWYPGEGQRRILRRRWRLTASASAAAFAGVAAFAAPTVRVVYAGARAEATMQAEASARRQFAERSAALVRVTQQLDEIERFARDRRTTTFILRDLTAALPESTAILSIRIDTVAGTMSVLAPGATDIIPSLAHLDGILSPRIVGAVTRDDVSGAQLERATIRFRFPGRSDK